MPLKLIPPREGRSKNWRVRGTYHGVYLDRSTETADRRTAEKLRAGWQLQIERGEIAGKGELTFAQAAASYSLSKGAPRFIGRVVDTIGPHVLARDVDQRFVDALAARMFPKAGPATRNRQVYTPIKAALAHSQFSTVINRPKGAEGQPRHIWLEPEQFDRLHVAAMQIDPELGLLFLTLFYTGLRLGEALSIERSKINLDSGCAFVGRTKNGLPRAVYLVDVLKAALSVELGRAASGYLFPGLRVLRAKGGSRFYAPAYLAYRDARVDPQGAPFHIGRHTFGKAMTRAGADLVATGVWRSRSAAAVYEHLEPTEEARKAALLPGAIRGAKSG